MRHRIKAFTLIELIVTVTIVGVLAVVAVPAFTTAINNSRADTEIGDIYRALSYTRLEAINRGVNVQLRPTATGTIWTGELRVVLSTGGDALRLVPALSANATLAAGSLTYIEFNNLGGLSNPGVNTVLTYTRGAATRTISLCLSGRIVQGGSC
ncbi:GspH/FimT family pseudopilin [Pseudomonas sp. nanlin1]|uniref:GspH/FimT family pseudopilin n=1 Tax=Pseudomonas sp. nanlin1 TaxID=3040605 RepID=UPI00388FAFFA